MKVKKDELLKVISAVKPALAKKEIILQTTHIIFTGDFICTYNGFICIIHPFKTDFSCSVQGEEFYKTIDSINEPEIDITVEENQIKVNSKRTKAGLSTIVGEKEKVVDLIKDLRERTTGRRFWKTLPTNFTQGLFLCSFSTSKNMNEKVICCIAVTSNEIISCDSLRASHYKLDSTVSDEMLLPSRYCIELCNYPVTKYGISNGWAHFLTDEDVMFSIRVMEGEYPFEKVRKFFRPPKDEITLPKEIQDVMKAAAVFADSDVDVAKIVEVTLSKNQFICKSKKERGWIEKTVEIEGLKVKSKITFFVNPIFFAEVLDKSTVMFLIINEDWPDKAVFINENFQHLIALQDSN